MARKRSDGEGVYLLPVYMPNGLWCMDCPAMRKEINARDVYYCRLTGEVFNAYAAPVLAPDTCPMRPLIYTEDDE
jgi:hypothetical protein